MKTDKNIAEENLKIPLDMVIDILTIVLREELNHEIIDVIPTRSTVVLEISYDRSDSRAQKAFLTIQDLLSQYQHYRHWEHEDLNWRDY